MAFVGRVLQSTNLKTDGLFTALARHFRVVKPDLRGFGNSMAPDKDGSVQIYAKDMLAVMDHLNIKKAIWASLSLIFTSPSTEGPITQPIAISPTTAGILSRWAISAPS